MIGNNLVFDKVNYRPEKFLQVISPIKKDIGFKKNREIKNKNCQDDNQIGEYFLFHFRLLRL